MQVDSTDDGADVAGTELITVKCFILFPTFSEMD